MNKYLGTKEILARPMTRGEYNAYRGWQLPADENSEDAGQLVEYIDGGARNHQDHTGYISWSPQDVFERAYKPIDTPKQRVELELAQLNERLGKLEKFIDSEAFSALAVEQSGLLRKQASLMRQYAVVLSDRLGIWN
ncbi:MAG: hypothetical protein RLZZ200_524 [Pseudomonadota bacterium]|jgi:hypothetical protein